MLRSSSSNASQMLSTTAVSSTSREVISKRSCVGGELAIRLTQSVVGRDITHHREHEAFVVEVDRLEADVDREPGPVVTLRLEFAAGSHRPHAR